MVRLKADLVTVTIVVRGSGRRGKPRVPEGMDISEGSREIPRQPTPPPRQLEENRELVREEQMLQGRKDRRSSRESQDIKGELGDSAFRSKL